MNKVMKWVLGIAIILAAVATLAVAYLDKDPETVPNIPGTIEKVREGVEVIKAEEPAASEVPVPE